MLTPKGLWSGLGHPSTGDFSLLARRKVDVSWEMSFKIEGNGYTKED